MGTGANYAGLDKAFKLKGATPSKTGMIAKITSADAVQTCDIASAATDIVVGVFTDNAPAPAGKNVYVNVRMSGIARVLVAAPVAKGAKVTTDAAGKGIATTTAGNTVVGIALEASTPNGYVDVLLTPGLKY